jgi:DNA-binding PadR family transcriptional regulator
MGVRFRKTPALLSVLEALRDMDRPYGLAIIERTGLASGTVYPLLARLEAEGWVTSEWESDDPAKGPRKRYYELTASGAGEAQAALAGRPSPSGARIVPRAGRPRLAGGGA